MSVRNVSRTGVFGALLLVPSMAWAQAAPGGGGAAPAGGGAAPAGGGGAPASGPAAPVYGGAVAPPPPGSALGGGNISGSSSRPITGPNDRDGFDFRQGGGGGTSFKGTGSPVVGGNVAGNIVPGLHLVKKGDTLWNICDSNFQNPYQWPRVWSYNPQIQNPHWIYPGDQIRLRAPGDNGGEQDALSAANGGSGRNFRDRRRVSPGTLFLQNQGYIEDSDSQVWGEITGSREDKMILMNFDEVYLKFAKDRDVKLGQELTIFRPFSHAGEHRIVEVQGTVRIDFYNPSEKVARGRIVEAVDTIERGARVGPIVRKIEVVSPKRNEKEVTASILASVEPTTLYGAQQIVFLDKGDKDGLAPGNRLFVIRRGDAWHDSLTTSTAAMRIPIERNETNSTEAIPKPRDTASLPEEVTAEIRVVTVRDHSAMALVTSSRREIEKGEQAVARKGY